MHLSIATGEMSVRPVFLSSDTVPQNENCKIHVILSASIGAHFLANGIMVKPFFSKVFLVVLFVITQ